MANESKGKPRFFPYTFEFQANRILDRQFGIIRSDIAAENCESIYKYLICNI